MFYDLRSRWSLYIVVQTTNGNRASTIPREKVLKHHRISIKNEFHNKIKKN